MANDLLYQQEIRSNCQKIWESFKLSNFYNEETSSEAYEIKNFRHEKGALSNLLRLAEVAAFTKQEVYLGLTTGSLSDMHSGSERLLSLLHKMRVFHETPAPPPQYDHAKQIDSSLEALKNEKEAFVTAFSSLYDVLCKYVNVLSIWTTPAAIDAQAELLKKTELGLQTQINHLTTRLEAQNTISPHAKTFDDYAASHQSAAFLWLWAGIILLAGLVWYSNEYIYPQVDTLIFNLPKPGTTPSQTGTLFFGVLVLRLFSLGVLASFVFWAFRNYRINKHNELLNRVRATSLRTFKDFSETTENSKGTHDLVIGKIADAVFDMRRLGYLSDKSPDPNFNVTELLDLMLKIKKD